jgi:hypothetical protein
MSPWKIPLSGYQFIDLKASALSPFFVNFSMIGIQNRAEMENP